MNTSRQFRRFHQVSRLALTGDFSALSAAPERAAAANVVTEYVTTATTCCPVSVPDGDVWFNASPDLGRLNPTTGVVTQFPALQSKPINGGMMQDILVGPDNNIWFGASFANLIGRSTLEGQVSTFPTSGWTLDLLVGPDGKIWFGEQQTNKIGRVTIRGQVSEFDTSHPTLDPIVGPDGSIWFGEFGASIGRVTLAGAVTEFPTTAQGLSSSLIVGPDGNVWFGTDLKIGKVTPAGQVSEYDIGGMGAFGLVVGPDNNIWFGGSYAAKVGRVTLDGKVALFNISNLPAGQAVGADKNIWFTEFGNKVGRVTLDGKVTEYDTVGATPYPPLLGPDGNIWFGDNGGQLASHGKIGKVTPAGVLTEFFTSALPNSLTLGPDGKYIYFGENTFRFGRVSV